MKFNPQFKLVFTELQTVFDSEARKSVQVETVLFTAPAEVTALSPLKEVNGTQIVELGITHQAVMRWLPVSQNMKCHRQVRGPDRSLIRENLRVISFQPMGQGNRYMRVQLSLDISAA
ncbi:hypothetical protein HKD28_15585 [Gluconobacter sp. LMG 1744]|uniref:hypothetical protein n=1 Tax=Gluconobacter cadivus TaxID=2728101 RepID=UPI001885680D|nr:hypothetical protein [Gluconobacter cadivus]MBF0892804.1 hypothetical protein [Gluconobacter cadivus]